MADIIQPKRGTAAKWTAVNPVLAEGEKGYETDTKKAKYGDGVTAWNNLPYPSSGSTGTGGTVTKADIGLENVPNVDAVSVIRGTVSPDYDTLKKIEAKLNDLTAMILGGQGTPPPTDYLFTDSNGNFYTDSLGDIYG